MWVGMVDTSEASHGNLLHNIVLFARVLRRAGIEVSATQVHAFAHACRYIDLGKRSEMKDAARCILVGRRQDLPIFDRAFDLFWQHRLYDAVLRQQAADAYAPPALKRQPQSTLFLTIETQPLGTGEDLAQVVPVQTYSAQEALRYKDFGQFTREEIEEAKRLMQEMPWEIGARETRRKERGGQEYLDLRATIRRNLKYGGEIVDLARMQYKWKPRSLVVLCDISGSMENYSRLFLHFIHALRGSYANVESFVFSTRLTRITRQLETRDVEIALRQVAHSVVDWSGGTRIGEALKTFNFRWGRRVLRPGAIVLIISDGWDRGEPELLQREMARLKRNVFRVIWLNPLLASPGYEPLTQGLTAALPFVDDFLPAHNLVSLEDLAERLSELNRAVGAERRAMRARP